MTACLGHLARCSKELDSQVQKEYEVNTASEFAFQSPSSLVTVDLELPFPLAATQLAGSSQLLQSRVEASGDGDEGKKKIWASGEGACKGSREQGFGGVSLLLGLLLAHVLPGTSCLLSVPPPPGCPPAPLLLGPLRMATVSLLTAL